jgi:(p)ppGpp synthase/HD superfamily hydrolase
VSIELAWHTAGRAHRGQKYGDHPYIIHIIDVTSRVLDEPEDVIIAAILHDAVEDGSLTFEEAHAEFGSRVAAALDALTRRNDYQMSETYAEYIDRLAKNPDAVTVKLADLEANLECDPPESLRERYEAAWQHLSNVKYPDDFDHEGHP